MKYFRIQFLVGLAAVSATLATAAHAQQFKSYSFDQHNRGQLAVAMKQIEESGSSGSGTAGTTAGVGATTIVCGGGAATAAANNTCIILNNASGVITTDQISDGDQTARSSEESNLDGNQISGADDVLSTLMQ